MSIDRNNTIAVAISGGVDSAVAAATLVAAGHRVIGMTLRLQGGDLAGDAAGHCRSSDRLDGPRQVCAHLGIPLHVVDHEAGFRAHVIDDFVAEYAAGRTPNPCVRCNERVKFGPLLRQARALGARHLATGHYARLEVGADGRPRLMRGADPAKDQSYFLFAVPPEELGAALFPLGNLTKPEVRARARALGLPNADRPESQEICFVPDGDHVAFLERTAAACGVVLPGPGELVDREGMVLGRHAGAHRFTIGQRRGFGAALGAGEPRYVVAVDAVTGRVVVGRRDEIGRRSIRVRDVRWLTERPRATIRATVQVRHRHPAAAAEVTPDGEGACARFGIPQVAAPGQAAVFYAGRVVLGGGWIE